MELNWTNLDTVIKDCMLCDQRDAAILAGVDLSDREAAAASLAARGARIVESAMQQVAFNADRLDARAADIKAMLMELPVSFRRSGGGGMSMMQMPFKGEEMEQWGEQWQADMLYALGAGVGLASFTVPRDMWRVLPGNMPYVTLEF